MPLPEPQPAPRVFVVDNDAAVRDSLRSLLGMLGYRVEAFDSAEAFLDRADPASEDSCLIVEVHLPGMTGIELLENLRQRRIALPTIVTTSRGDVPMAVRALRAGAFDFFEKPFVDRVLTDRVREALERLSAEHRS